MKKEDLQEQKYSIINVFEDDFGRFVTLKNNENGKKLTKEVLSSMTYREIRRLLGLQ